MSEDPYYAIAKLSSSAHFIFNLQTAECSYKNDKFTELLSINSDDCSLETLKSIIVPEDYIFLEGLYEELKVNKIVEGIEFRVKADDDIQLLRLNAYLTVYDNVESIVGSFSDVTAENNQVENLKKFANKKNSILNILSHDLKGPLGMANMLIQALDTKLDSPQLSNLTRTLSKVIKQSIDLIVDLTNREFLATADVDLVKQRVDIALKLREYMEEFSGSEAAKLRTINFSSSAESIFVFVDEPKFIQIVNNLISNSLKFTRENEGKISLHVEEGADTVKFIFADNGIGIPSQFHSTLFEKFTDARRKGLQGEPTIGLGLLLKRLLTGTVGPYHLKVKKVKELPS